MALASDNVLKIGLVGFVYRWLRNAGVVALAYGTWLIASSAYQDAQDGRARATVSRLEVACFLQGDGFFYQAFTVDAECGATDSERARYRIPLVVREVMTARLAFQSEGGADYVAWARLDDLNAPQLQSGDEVDISYDRSNPERVRAAVTAASYLKGARVIAGGMLALLAVVFMRWAAAWRGDVDAEIAALRRAHAARQRR